MSKRGHNEKPMRLDMLAEDARQALEKVEQGEESAIAGWLAYGMALNEGRSLFPGDREFGEWLRTAKLAERNGEPVHDHDRAAAMWAAANADQFEEARQRGNPRTIRGIHAKWKEIEAEREAERFAEEQRKAAEARRAQGIPSETEGDSTAAPERQDGGSHGSRLSAGRTADPSDAGETVAEGDEPAAGGSPAPEPQPDPYGYAKLTDAALLDTANGLRADLDDEKSAHRKTKDKLKEANSKLKEFEGDQAESIRQLQKKAENAGKAKWKALEDRDAYHRQVHALKKRVEELERMGVPL